MFNMIIRKTFTFTILLLVLATLMFIMFSLGGGMGFYAFVFSFGVYGMVAMLCLGFPVSVLSEWLIWRMQKRGMSRILLSLAVHVCSGGIFVNIYLLLVYPSVLENSTDTLWGLGSILIYTGIAFFVMIWLIDELLRLKLPNDTWS